MEEKEILTVVNQVNSYYEPEDRQCEDDTVEHGEHIYMRKSALGLRIWYQCPGFAFPEPEMVEIEIVVPIEDVGNV